MDAALVDQVASVLGIATAEAEQALESAMAQFRHELATRGEARLAGVGLFRIQHSAVIFQPSEGLELAVNHRYAGLTAVRAPAVDSDLGEPPRQEAAEETTLESQPPMLDTRGEVELDDDRTDVEHSGPEFAGDETDKRDTPVADQAHLDEAVPAHPKDVDETDDFSDDELDHLIEGVWMEGDESDEAEHPLGPPPPEIIEEADFAVVEPSSSVGADLVAATEEEVSDSPDDVASDQSPAAHPPRSEEPAEVAATPSRADTPGFAATRDAVTEPEVPSKRRFGWLLAALLIVAIGVAAFWLVTQLTSDRYVAASDEPPSATAPAPRDPPTADAPDAVDAPDHDPAPTPAPQEGPLFGADPVDPAQGGVTFALSETSRSVADQRAERYRLEGYRVAVQAATVRGMQVYRIFIGQFASAEDAEAHRSDLPDDVPSDIWIHRL